MKMATDPATEGLGSLIDLPTINEPPP